MVPIKVVIADDHKIFRHGLRLSISVSERLAVIGEAEDGEALMNLLNIEEADVVLLDLKMPKLDGFAASERIRAEFPDVKIIILTMYDDEQFIIRLMENGANGYLVKNTDPEEIIEAIITVFETGYYFSDLVSNTLLKKVIRKDTSQTSKLQKTFTDKELEILQLICEEYTSPEIGKKVFLSPRTVEGIRAKLLEKTGARNTVGLVIYAIRTGLFV